MSLSPPDAGLPAAGVDETAYACDIFYLRIERQPSGYRWLVTQFGVPEPVLASPSLYPSDHAAKTAGRVSLERFMIRRASLPSARD